MEVNVNIIFDHKMNLNVIVFMFFIFTYLHIMTCYDDMEGGNVINFLIFPIVRCPVSPGPRFSGCLSLTMPTALLGMLARVAIVNSQD